MFVFGLFFTVTASNGGGGGEGIILTIKYFCPKQLKFSPEFYIRSPSISFSFKAFLKFCNFQIKKFIKIELLWQNLLNMQKESVKTFKYAKMYFFLWLKYATINGLISQQIL